MIRGVEFLAPCSRPLTGPSRRIRAADCVNNQRPMVLLSSDLNVQLGWGIPLELLWETANIWMGWP